MSKRLDLKKLRLRHSMKQNDIASLLNVPQSSVSSMEHFNTAVSQAYLDILNNHFGKEVVDDFFIEVDDEKVFLNGVHGHGNGLHTHVSMGGMTSADLKMIESKFKVVETNIGNLFEKVADINDKLTEELKEVREENKELHRQLTAMMVFCARNGIDFSDVIKN